MSGLLLLLFLTAGYALARWVDVFRKLGRPVRPRIVCLCGSTRFLREFQTANLRETLAGRIVLTIGCDTKADGDIMAGWPEVEKLRVKAELDELHKRKIDLADEILVLNVGGYIGTSTQSEIDYAWRSGKKIRWLEEVKSP